MPAIHQFVAGFSNGDAISNEALVMRDIFRSWGHDACIFSEAKRILPQLRKQARDVSEYAAAARRDDVVLLHLSIGSPVNEVFRTLPCRKALLYHNVTPAHYFNLVNQRTAYSLAKGREQIRSLAGVAEVNMADSRYNAGELGELEYPEVKVLPLILDLEKLRGDADRKTLSKFSGGLKNILFVGRCVPNKKLEHLISAFACFQDTVDRNTRLIHVGSYAGSERYYYLLLTHARDLGVRNVHFAGAVTQSQLNAFYRCADVFLCMSEHEGFCIPVIESMLLDVPVMAYAEAAVPETMDGAGVLFTEKRYDYVAEMMGRLIGDRRLRDAVIRGQRDRIARYADRDLAAELRQHLSPLLG